MFLGREAELNWFEAAGVCQFLGGQLAELNTPKEIENLKEYLQAENDCSLWLGNDVWIGK